MYQCCPRLSIIHDVELLDDMNISAHGRPAMQWEEHSSIEARQLAGGGDWQEGRPRLGGEDAGRPHQEPGGITSLAVNA